MAFKSEALKEADARIRRINSILRKAAEAFGVNSMQYQQREQRIKTAIGESNAAYFGIDAKTGALQVKRSKGALEQSLHKGSIGLIKTVEAMQSVETLKSKMLAEYVKRMQEPIWAEIQRRFDAGYSDIRDLQKRLEEVDPSYVDPSIKGRKARAEARKRQIAAAIRDQAEYYQRLNEDISEALNQIYQIEEEIGEELDVHYQARTRYTHQGQWDTTEEKEDLLRALQEELRRNEHRITDAYESGLQGSILGRGGID